MPDENAPWLTHNQGLLAGDDVLLDEFGEPVAVAAPAPTQPKTPAKKPDKDRVESHLKSLLDGG